MSAGLTGSTKSAPQTHSPAFFVWLTSLQWQGLGPGLMTFLTHFTPQGFCTCCQDTILHIFAGLFHVFLQVSAPLLGPQRAPPALRECLSQYLRKHLHVAHHKYGLNERMNTPSLTTRHTSEHPRLPFEDLGLKVTSRHFTITKSPRLTTWSSSVCHPYITWYICPHWIPTCIDATDLLFYWLKFWFSQPTRIPASWDKDYTCFVYCYNPNVRQRIGVQQFFLGYPSS